MTLLLLLVLVAAAIGYMLRGTLGAILGAMLCLLVLLLLSYSPSRAEARPAPSAWTYQYATWYGPGFYGKTTKCGQRYTQYVRGVAARNMRCGSKLTICRRGRCVRVKVIDGGGYFDLSARTAKDLCRCNAPYSMNVRYARGWLYGQALR